MKIYGYYKIIFQNVFYSIVQKHLYMKCSFNQYIECNAIEIK